MRFGSDGVSGKAIEFSAQHGEVHVIVAVSRIVVGVRVTGLEIDEGRDPFGMTRADGTEFFATKRVTDKNRPLDS
jgi:hypothetical protein